MKTIQMFVFFCGLLVVNTSRAQDVLQKRLAPQCTPAQCAQNGGTLTEGSCACPYQFVRCYSARNQPAGTNARFQRFCRGRQSSLEEVAIVLVGPGRCGCELALDEPTQCRPEPGRIYHNLDEGFRDCEQRARERITAPVLGAARADGADVSRLGGPRITQSSCEFARCEWVESETEAFCDCHASSVVEAALASRDRPASSTDAIDTAGAAPGVAAVSPTAPGEEAAPPRAPPPQGGETGPAPPSHVADMPQPAVAPAEPAVSALPTGDEHLAVTDRGVQPEPSPSPAQPPSPAAPAQTPAPPLPPPPQGGEEEAAEASANLCDKVRECTQGRREHPLARLGLETGYAYYRAPDELRTRGMLIRARLALTLIEGAGDAVSFFGTTGVILSSSSVEAGLGLAYLGHLNSRSAIEVRLGARWAALAYQTGILTRLPTSEVLGATLSLQYHYRLTRHLDLVLGAGGFYGAGETEQVRGDATGLDLAIGLERRW